MSFTFELRRGTAAAWTSENPILHPGEPGYETDTRKMKIGDGVLSWVDLPYYPPNSLVVAGVASVDGRTGVVTLTDLYAALSHAHAQGDITGLAVSLSGKADTVHTHGESDITSLITDLSDLSVSVSGKANTVHTHAESSVTGLVADLADKAPLVHTHSSPSPVDLTDGATIPTDASLGDYFRVTLGGDRTLSNPTGMSDGQRVLWEISQDGTGSRLLTLGTAFIFGADLTSVVLSTTPDKIDILGAIYNSSLGKWLVVAFTKGF